MEPPNRSVSGGSSKRQNLLIANVVLALVLVGLIIGLLAVGPGGGTDETAKVMDPDPTVTTTSALEPAEDASDRTTDETMSVTDPPGTTTPDVVPRDDFDADEVERAMATVGDQSGEATNIVLPTGTRPPDMPTELDGWTPMGPVQRTQVRVFEDDPFSYAFDVGTSLNSCGDVIWTLRWRMANPDVQVRTALEFSALLVDRHDVEIDFDPRVGGAGFMSGFICQAPVFAWVSTTGEGSLADVIVEFQHWERAV